MISIVKGNIYNPASGSREYSVFTKEVTDKGVRLMTFVASEEDLLETIQASVDLSGFSHYYNTAPEVVAMLEEFGLKPASMPGVETFGLLEGDSIRLKDGRILMLRENGWCDAGNNVFNDFGLKDISNVFKPKDIKAAFELDELAQDIAETLLYRIYRDEGEWKVDSDMIRSVARDHAYDSDILEQYKRKIDYADSDITIEDIVEDYVWKIQNAFKFFIF